MSDKPYIAEFHDLAKLLDKDALGTLGIKVRGQRFDGIDYGASSLSKPDCPSWYAPYCEDLKDLDSKVARDCGKWAADVFLTRIADRLASSFRLTEFEEPIDKRTRTLAGWRKIWKDQVESPDWGGSLISSKEAFCSLLEFWDRCANSDEVIEYFKRALSAIPEDKAPPYNITSLHSHLRLVGMIYRVLRGAVKTLPAGLSLGGKDVSQATQAMGGRVRRECARQLDWDTHPCGCWHSTALVPAARPQRLRQTGTHNAGDRIHLPGPRPLPDS